MCVCFSAISARPDLINYRDLSRNSQYISLKEPLTLPKNPGLREKLELRRKRPRPLDEAMRGRNFKVGGQLWGQGEGNT